MAENDKLKQAVVMHFNPSYFAHQGIADNVNPDETARNQSPYRNCLPFLFDMFVRTLFKITDLTNLKEQNSQQSHNVTETSLQRRCNVTTLQRRCNDVVATLCVCRASILPSKTYKGNM